MKIIVNSREIQARAAHLSVGSDGTHTERASIGHKAIEHTIVLKLPAVARCPHVQRSLAIASVAKAVVKRTRCQGTDTLNGTTVCVGFCFARFQTFVNILQLNSSV